jgi:hypothetical protein
MPKNRGPKEVLYGTPDNMRKGEEGYLEERTTENLDDK